MQRYAQVSLTAAAFLGFNEATRIAFRKLGVAMPHTLGGMLIVIAMLLAGKAVSAQTAGITDKVVHLFGPLRDWVARWMPVFFVPSLISLPQATAGIAAEQALKVGQVTAIGWLLSLLFAAGLVQNIRGAAHSEVSSDEEAEIAPKAVNPFTTMHYAVWAAITLLTAAATPFLPGHQGTLGTVCLMGSTILSYMLGVALPAGFKRIVHPIIVCTVLSSACCAFWGALADMPYDRVLAHYMQQGSAAWGAGNLLMAMLAVVVLCDGTRVYLQRRLVRKHAAEIFGTTIGSALFSLFATAKLAAVLGVESSLARSLLPRAVTVALALPMTETLGGSSPICAAMVCFTGLMGAAFGQALMGMMGVRDEISRGVTQAASSHGMGTSAMAASEPQALPFCAVTIAVMGTVSNLLLCIPPVTRALIAITG